MCSPWQNIRSFEETNLHMLENEILCDVTILAGRSRREIKAHKFLLASRCPVFYVMFCDTSDRLSDIIEITDVDFDTVKEILRFIYTENCDINLETVLSVLTGAKKYNLPRLEEKCRAFLNDSLSAKTACTILKMVHDLEEKDLEQKCVTFITETGNDAISNEAFTSLPKSLIRKIFISDSLQCDEEFIYEASKKWAFENCKHDLENSEPNSTDLRNKLGDLLYLIRFPSMSFETFASSASKDDILSADEKVSIFHCIANKSASPDCKFSMKARIKKTEAKKDSIMVKRFLNAPSKQWMYNGLADSISFVISAEAKCLGVGLFSPINKGSVKGMFKLVSTKRGALFERHVELNYNPEKVSEDVLFDGVVELLPGELYTLSCNFKGSYTYYGTGGQKKVSVGHITISFVENDFSQNGTDCGEGQFNYLILQSTDMDSK